MYIKIEKNTDVREFDKNMNWILVLLAEIFNRKQQKLSKNYAVCRITKYRVFIDPRRQPCVPAVLFIRSNEKRVWKGCAILVCIEKVLISGQGSRGTFATGIQNGLTIDPLNLRVTKSVSFSLGLNSFEIEPHFDVRQSIF